MYKPSQYINDICSECNPRTYDMTLAKYANQENVVEVVAEPDYSFAEYLYECCQCGFKSWVDDQWVKRHTVEIKSIARRKAYINSKSFQLDQITNAHKYTRRLSRIMLYHKLLTVVEVDEVGKITKGGLEQ